MKQLKIIENLLKLNKGHNLKASIPVETLNIIDDIESISELQ